MLAIAAAFCLAQTTATLTPCQQCCAPGGDCSKAYKGQPGKCCGQSEGGQAFCCPGGFTDGAKCYRCSSSYRCYTSFSSNICGGGTGGHRHTHGHTQHRNDNRDDSFGSIIFLGIIIVVGVLFCSRRQMDGPMYYSDKPAYGAPMGIQPAMGMPMAPGYGGYGGGGYSGGAVAGSAAAGFVGGMLVSEALDSHHHGGYSGGYGDGGGYVSGGGYSDGGFSDGGGGGDSGFSADS